MSDSTTQRKQEEDFSAKVDEVLPQAEETAKAGQLVSAIDKLLVLEKQTRNAADLASSSRVVLAIIRLCWEARDLPQLNLQLTALSKKHGQLRQVSQRMVEQAIGYLDELQGADKLTVIETLREVTEGKIYLEVPRARVTRMLSKIREDAGDEVQASDLLQELQVETFGSMDKREKIDFILEQMRLLRVREDWDRLGIVAKKINTNWLGEEANEDLKLRYHALMIRWALHYDKYLDLCKHHRSVFECKSVQADENRWKAALRNALIFVILAPYDNEQSDLLNRVAKEPKLEQLEDAQGLATCFTASELMRWPGISELYGPKFRHTRIFAEKGRPLPAAAADIGDIEEEKVDHGVQGDKRWETLHTRVVEHNVRVVAKYYTRITLARLSTLLDLDRAATEALLCRLVSSKQVHARIDRPAGTIDFTPTKRTDVVLNEWSSDVGKLMSLVDKVAHLIQKERAIAQARVTVKA